MPCEKELDMRSEKKGFQTTQGPPQEVSRRPRTLQGLEVGANLAPRGVPKSIQNRSKSELGSLQDPRPPKTPPRFQNGPQNGFQIVAKSTSKSIQNSFTTDAKCACKLFLRHAGMQVCRFAGMQVCGYAGMQVCRYVGMQVCKYE